MKRYYDLIEHAKTRRKELGIGLREIAARTGLGYRTVTRFFSGEDVKVSTLEKITMCLGLDLNGHPLVSVNDMLHTQARKKAKEIVALVQDTSSLECQGLSRTNLSLLIEEAKTAYLTGPYRKMLWVE